MVRDSAGDLHALLNTCRHCGYRFCEAAQGVRPTLRLPVPPVDLRPRRTPHPRAREPERASPGLRGVGSPPRARRGSGTASCSCASAESSAPLTPALDVLAADMVPARPEHLREAFRESYNVEANWRSCWRTTWSATTAVASIPSCARPWPSTPCTRRPRAGPAPTWWLHPAQAGARDDVARWPPRVDAARRLRGPRPATGRTRRWLRHRPAAVAADLPRRPHDRPRPRPVDVRRSRWETRWYVAADAVEGVDYDEALTAVGGRRTARTSRCARGHTGACAPAASFLGPLHPER